MEKIEEIISRIDSHQNKKAKKEIQKYLKKWPWFIVLCIIGIMLGFYKYKNSPNIYEVKSQILVKEQNQDINSVLSFNNPIMPMRNRTNIENKIGILQSYTLFRKALNNLNWNTSWYKKELLYKKELYKNEPFILTLPPNALNVENVLIEIVPLNNREYQIQAEGQTNQNGILQNFEIDEIVRYGNPFNNDFFNFTISPKNEEIDETYYLVFNNLNSLTNSYLKRTTISADDPSSDIITIMIKGANIQKEADFINELNNVFIQFGVENKNRNSDNSLKFIDDQLSRIETQLKSSEENFSNYRQNNQVVNLSQEAQIIYKNLEEIENKKYMTQLQIDYYKDLQQYLDDSEKISEMVNPSVIGITDDNLNKMLSKLMDLYSRREVLSYSVKEKSPSYEIIEKEIKITRDGLDETLKNQLKATQSILQSAENRHQSLEARIKKLPETEKELIGIQREFDLNNELYTYLLQKRAEASMSKASIASEVQVIDPAMVESSTLVGPSLIKNVGIGLFGGVFIPFIFISLANYFNTKIETREEIEKQSNIPVLEGIVKHSYKEKLPVIYHPRSGIAESFRGIKSNLNALLDNQGSKVISINSLIPGEGKSFISSNFSVTLANNNKKTLLIGTDMHKPTLHNFLGVKLSDGLTNYLKNQMSFEEIISETKIPNLHFIQAGGEAVANPSDLMNAEKLENLIELARNKYDYIVIDSAPLLLVPDAILTSNYADISLFLLRINFSHKEQINQINKVVDFNKIKKAAIIINGAADRGYGYGHKYWKKGYGEYKYKINTA